MEITSILFFGFLLGLKHAVEADHLAAISTIVAERKNALSSTLVGGLWGVGHTVSLLVVGGLVVFLKIKISERVESNLEMGVGLMLVILGVNAIVKLRKADKIHIHSHRHDGHMHTHIHAHAKKASIATHHFIRASPRSIAVGMVHGLAGSAALMLLIVPTITSPMAGMFYILIFGIGSIGGMMIMSFLMGLPVHITAGKYRFLNKSILGGAGMFSFALGGFVIYEKLIA